jgi:hypothetical protein
MLVAWLTPLTSKRAGATAAGVCALAVWVKPKPGASRVCNSKPPRSNKIALQPKSGLSIEGDNLFKIQKSCTSVRCPEPTFLIILILTCQSVFF